MIKKLVGISIIGALIASCSSTKTPPVSDTSPTSDVKPSTDSVSSKPVTDSNVDSTPAPTTPVTKTNHNSVYFAFDKYNINDSYSGLIKANSNYLAATKDAKLQVQGNTDDVGSVEYNLALGQRRAEVVEKALIANGASPSQIEATSNGKLKAKYENKTDAGRAKNRRSDMMFVSGKPNGYSTDENATPMVDSNFFAGTVEEGVIE